MFGQENCNCNADLNFVIEKIEKEHPGFSLNVTDKNIEFYNNLKDSLTTETNKENVPPAGRRAAAKGAEGTGTRPGKKADMQCCAQIKPAFAGQAQQTK